MDMQSDGQQRLSQPQPAAASYPNLPGEGGNNGQEINDEMVNRMSSAEFEAYFNERFIEDNKKPLNETFSSQLPRHKFKQDSSTTEDNKQCRVCLFDFEDADDVVTLTCFHVFHEDCIINWFK